MKKTVKRKGGQIGLWLPEDLLYRVRAACEQNDLSLRQFCAKALDKEVRLFERMKNGGRRYDATDDDDTRAAA